jgi:hypothetical protein
MSEEFYHNTGMGGDPQRMDESDAIRELKPTNPKDAIGSTKPPVSTVPFPLIAELGLAWLEGSCKYGRHNGRVIGVRASVYIDAMFRHVFAWWDCNQNTDPDSGLSHLVKAMACLGMLRDAEIQQNLNDDRPPKTPEAYLEWLKAKTAELLAKYPNPEKPFTELNKGDKRNA